MSDTEPVPAATVVLIRENTEQQELEVLLVQRNARLVFHGGHWVFPGGRLDNEDFGDAELPRLEYPAALRAAVRETREEAGIEIAEEQLIHTAHWTTPPKLPRRFCTWFFLCPLYQAVEVKVDNDEILDYRWLSPNAAIAAAESDSMVLPRPTLTTLRDLSGHATLPSLLSGLARAKIRVFPENSLYYRPKEMGCFLD
tara:strand:- start:9249 stop:9842 length:594 start_codon:yes stop_codon:yes gene_type:complete